jgi:hypothetical protein
MFIERDCHGAAYTFWRDGRTALGEVGLGLISANLHGVENGLEKAWVPAFAGMSG